MNNETFVLWRAEFSHEAYTDQMGLTHSGNIVLEEIPVRVIERKLVPGEFSGKTEEGFEGLIAVADDGRIFYNNWNTFAETVATPRWYWHDENQEYFNALICYNMSYPIYVRDNQKAKPKVPICPLHDYAGDCFKCQIEKMTGREYGRQNRLDG